jgi:AAA+ superfamily predicted ATPase
MAPLKTAADALVVTEAARLMLEGRADFLEGAQDDSASAELGWRKAHPDPTLASLNAEIESRRSGPRSGLIRTFGLSAAEAALLDIAVAVAVDPALEETVAGLQGLPRRPVPTEALVRRLYGFEPGDIWRPTSPLARWRLVCVVDDGSGRAPAFAADRRIVDWYFGRAALDGGLVGICTLPDDTTLRPDWDVDDEARVVAELADGAGAVRVTVLGPENSGRGGYLLALTARLGLQALYVDGSALARTDMAAAYPLIQRFSVLTGRVPIWTTPPPDWPGVSEHAPVQMVVAEAGEQLPGRRFVDHLIQMPGLTPTQRSAFWSRIAGDAPIPMALAHASPREIADIAPLAVRAPKIAESLLHQRAELALSALGTIRRPTVHWDDIVLPAGVQASLKNYATEARLRGELLANPNIRRLYSRDAAQTACFTGPPGVGKTMAAECIAAELGLPLLVIDVARTVSKYIGDTAKNLSRIFALSQRFGCILFFDEADAYFSKRSAEVKDSHDRHANADTNHLLQLIENNDIFVILSTNKRSAIDEAFFRRIRHSIEFHRPNQPERQRLWRQFAALFLPAADLERLDASLCDCAERYDLSPAQIKAAMLSAHYAAAKARQPIDEVHLLIGLTRELRKEGRNLPPELARLAQQSIEEAAHVA